MTHSLHIILIGMLVPLLGVFYLVWRLYRRVRKLRAQFKNLDARVVAMRNDLSGLCSGAVGVDHRVQSNEQRVRNLLQRLEELESAENEDEKSYQRAIKLVQEGCTAEELSQQFSLTADEASLLVRLYQNDPSD